MNSGSFDKPSQTLLTEMSTRLCLFKSTKLETKQLFLTPEGPTEIKSPIDATGKVK